MGLQDLLLDLGDIQQQLLKRYQAISNHLRNGGTPSSQCRRSCLQKVHGYDVHLCQTPRPSVGEPLCWRESGNSRGFVEGCWTAVVSQGCRGVFLPPSGARDYLLSKSHRSVLSVTMDQDGSILCRESPQHINVCSGFLWNSAQRAAAPRPLPLGWWWVQCAPLHF